MIGKCKTITNSSLSGHCGFGKNGSNHFNSFEDFPLPKSSSRNDDLCPYDFHHDDPQHRDYDDPGLQQVRSS